MNARLRIGDGHGSAAPVASAAEIDDLLAASIRGEIVDWPDRLPLSLEQDVLKRAEYHGVTALIDESISKLAPRPSSLATSFHEASLAHAFWELRHQQVLAEAIGALLNCGIAPLLFKGSALAYALYSNPVWRIRADTDALVSPHDADRAAGVLQSLGFRRQAGVSGELVSYQETFTLLAEDGSQHAIDLHRRINNSQLLAQLFSYDELRATARALPALCAGALVVAPVPAMLLACLHRATHIHNPYYFAGEAHFGGDRLIWLYDIHLLAQSFTAADWDEFLQQAMQKGLCATSLDGLARSCNRFGTPVPDEVRKALAKSGEPVTAYLNGSRLRQGWIDLSALPRPADRLRLARELLFPPAAYMRAKYASAQPGWLPWLYARRAFAGCAKRLRAAR